MTSVLEKLIELSPPGSNLDPGWKFWIISSNSAITMDVVEAHPDWPWDIRELSKNTNITWNFVKSHWDWNWNWNNLSMNSGIPLQVILTTTGAAGKKWEWRRVCARTDVTPEVITRSLRFIVAYKKGLWTHEDLYGNRNLTMDFVLEFSTYFGAPTPEWKWSILSHFLKFTPEQFHLGHWDYEYFSLNFCVTPEVIRDNLDKPWNWGALSCNKNITFQFVLENLHLPWDWVELSLYMEYTIDDVLTHPILPWDYPNVLFHRNFDPKRIKDYMFIRPILGAELFDELLSSYAHITDEDIISDPSFWNNRGLSINSNITFKVMKLFPLQNWNWQTIMCKKYITIPDLYRYLCTKKYNHHEIQVLCNNTSIQDWEQGRNFPYLPSRIQTQVTMIMWIGKIQGVPRELGHLICKYLVGS